MTVAKRARSGDFFVAAILLVLALLLGGGSAVAPVQRMIVELAGVFALGWMVARGARMPRNRSVLAAFAILAALVLLVVIQIVPLPPGLWRSLPGRALIAKIMDVAGGRDAWLPWSLDPAATREAGLFLIPPVSMFLATLRLDRRNQMKLLMAIAIAAIVSALLVMLQAQGATWLTIYDAPHVTKGKGIFANKNHNAALLVTAIPLIAMLGRRLQLLQPARMQSIVTGVVVVVLAIAVAGCLSRAGLALLPLALLACVPLLGGWTFMRRHVKALLVAAMALILAAILISQSSIVQETLDRFNTTQEGRYLFWPDVIHAIRQFLPWGSGLGTFVPVFRINESLAAVHETYTNHAHSDYLEIALEAGIPGLLLVMAFLIWFVVTAWARLRLLINKPDFYLVVASAIGIILLLAASIVDYPLRTLLLSCVFAVLCAIVAFPISDTPASTANSPQSDH